MLAELSVIWISLSVIVLCWAVVRINQKIDEAVSNYKRFNELDAQEDIPESISGARQRAPYPVE